MRAHVRGHAEVVGHVHVQHVGRCRTVVLERVAHALRHAHAPAEHAWRDLGETVYGAHVVNPALYMVHARRAREARARYVRVLAVPAHARLVPRVHVERIRLALDLERPHARERGGISGEVGADAAHARVNRGRDGLVERRERVHDVARRDVCIARDFQRVRIAAQHAHALAERAVYQLDCRDDRHTRPAHDAQSVRIEYELAFSVLVMFPVRLARYDSRAVDRYLTVLDLVTRLEDILCLHAVDGVEHALDGRVVVRLEVGALHLAGTDARGDALGNRLGDFRRIRRAGLIGFQDLLARVLSGVEQIGQQRHVIGRLDERHGSLSQNHLHRIPGIYPAHAPQLQLGHVDGCGVC